MIYLCLFYLCFVDCSPKEICFTTASYDTNCYGTSIKSVTAETNLEEKITENLDDSITEVKIVLSGDFEYKFPLKLFNNKILNIQLNMNSKGNFDITEIQNIDIKISSSSSNSQVKFEGTSLNDDQSSLELSGIQLTFDVEEIHLKSFSYEQSEFTFSKIYVNSFSYPIQNSFELTLDDNDLIFGEKTVIFTGEEQSLSLKSSSSNNDLIFNNQKSEQSITSFNFELFNSITFNGNEFSEAATLSFSNCLIIQTNVGFLPISSFQASASNDFQLIASKSLNFKGSITIPSSRSFLLKTADDCSSRVAISIDSISFLSIYSNLQFASSWVDLNVQSLTLQSGSYSTIPIYPCIGSGGCSTATINAFNYGGSGKLSFSSLEVKIDVFGEQNDESLANLINNEWNVIVLRSFSNISPVEKFTSIKYNPSDINGFQKDASILTAKSTVSDDYVVTFTASSFKSLPILLCYTSSSSCSSGTVVNDISTLPSLIPDYAKMVNLTLLQSLEELDLSAVPTTGATFTVSVSDSYSNYNIQSIKMNEISENANIDHLVFKSMTFNSGTFQLYSKEVTFTDCKISSSSQPVLQFSEQTSLVNIDKTSFTNLNSYVSETFPLTKISSVDCKTFEITDSEFVCQSAYSITTRFPRDKLSNVIFVISVSSSSEYSLDYKISSSSIDSVSLQLESDFDTCQLKVNFQNLNTISSANKIGIDIKKFAQATIDLNNFPYKDYLQFTGDNIEIINQGVELDSNLCVCNNDDECSLCEEGKSKITYDQLSQAIQSVSAELFEITIVGSTDENIPTLSFDGIENKNMKIVGVGENPKIRIDYSTEYLYESNFVEFSQICIVPQISDKSFQISNIKLDKYCSFDQSFNQVELIVGSLECGISILVFKSVLVKKSLVLSENEANSESTTKVSFDSGSTFEFTLPGSVVFNGPKLLIEKIEFDLTSVSPSFSIQQDLTEFNIIGNAGNIDSIGSNIVLEKSSTLQSLHISGTWSNENPTKFIIFNDFESDLYLESENIPINIIFNQPKSIFLQSEIVSVAGSISFTDQYTSTKNYTISTSKTEKVTFSVNSIISSSSYTSNIEFMVPNIDMVINTMDSDTSSINLQFYLLVDLNHFNKIEVINKIDKSSLFKYGITCIVSGSLKDQEVNDFIGKNLTLIVLNEENIVTSSSSDIKFGENVPAGFNLNNFKFVVDQNQLIFYNFISPYKAPVDLYYGNCVSTATQINNDDLSQLEKFIQVDKANVTITFCSSISSELVLDLSKEGISINNLNLIGSSNSGSTVPIKFGQSIANLTIQKITLRVSEDNGEYSIQNATLIDTSSFSSPDSYSHLLCLNVDQTSLFASGMTEFANEFNIVIDSSSLTINYSPTGLKLIYSQTQMFDIDVDKYPKTNLYVKSKSSPLINLEENVQELKQVNSFVLDSTTINIGSNWNQLKSTTSKVVYSLNNQEEDISIIASSFPFESWDLMYKYAIQFSSSLSPYSFTDKLTINNQNLVIKTTTETLSAYSVTFDEVLMSGQSSIKCISSSSSGIISIKKLSVQQGEATLSDYVVLTDDISLDSESSLNGQFSIGENLASINIDWDLDKVGLLNPSSSQNSVPQAINVIYKGSSIQGKEEQFDEFLSNGIVIIKNFASDLTNNVHFQSQDENVFADGDELALKVQIINENEIQLILTRKFVIDETSSEAETNTEEEKDTDSLSSSEEETISDIISDSIESETNTQTLDLPNPTQAPSFIEPTIDDSFTSNSEFIKFVENGFENDGSFISTENANSDVLLIKSNSEKVTLQTSETGQLNNFLFVSPQTINMIFTISSPQDEREDYGTGQFGIHANSKDPTVELPRLNVPLNIFNDEKSVTKFKYTEQGRRNLNLLDTNHQISLKKLTISKGKLDLDLPDQTSEIHFNDVEAFLNGNLVAKRGESIVVTSIESLLLNSGSIFSISEVKFNKSIVANDNSKLIIEKNAKISEHLTLELSETSFINFRDSVIEGICKEIKIQRKDVVKNSKILKNEFNEDEEVNINLICGSKFDCSNWKTKYNGNDSFYKYAKCTSKENDVCLTLSNVKEKSPQSKKKKGLSTGIIAAIVVVCIVVVIVVSVLIAFFVKKSRYNLAFKEIQDDNDDDYSVSL